MIRMTDETDVTGRPFGRAFRPAAYVARVAPYAGTAQTPLFLPHRERIAKLDWNECVRPPSPKVRAALAEYVKAGELNWYPDVEATALRAALVEYTGVAAPFLRAFGGSDAALECIARTFLGPGDEVVWCPPSYDNFRVCAESTGAALVAAPIASIWEPDPGAILSAVTERTRLVYLVNPNNPTGTLYSPEQIASLLWACPNLGFVVDEAYYEYSGTTAAALLSAHPNLMITRSFSKAFGLAGLRIGYVMSDPANLQQLDRVRIGKNTGTLAQVAACAALADPEYTRATVAESRLAMRTLSVALERLGVEVRTTPANFVLVKVHDPDAVCRFLSDRLVFVRDRSSVVGLGGNIRITVGDMRSTERVIETFRAMPPRLLTRPDNAGPRITMVRPRETACPADQDRSAEDRAPRGRRPAGVSVEAGVV